MATQPNANALLEKKIVPSPIPTKTRKSSTTSNVTSQSATPDRKQVPNYSKPTISSSGLGDQPNPPPKNQGTSSTKPNFNRRKSFDKPQPSTSSSSSTIQNKSQTTSLRSPSCVSSKVHSLPRSRSKKYTKPIMRYVKKTNTTASTTNEKETNENLGEQLPKEVDNSKKDDDAFPVNDIVEKEAVIETSSDKLAIPEHPNGENRSTCSDEPCTVEDRAESEVDVDVKGEKKVSEEENHVDKKVEENDMEKLEPENDGQYEKEDEKKEDGNESPEENVSKGNDDVVKPGKNSEIESKDEQLKGGKVEERKDTSQKEVKNDARNVSGKKEAQVPYNDVIEETKNKLLEKRKNKVLALVGAFETVISLEEPGA